VNELKKLEEDYYFLNCMKAAVGEPAILRHHLSAFLTASRSVLQYAHKEARGKSGGQAWYNEHLRLNPLLRFFKDERDTNIHVEPIVPIANTAVEINEALSFIEDVVVEKYDSMGRLIETVTHHADARPEPVPLPANITYRYRFTDWSGSEDLCSLCESYLSALRSLVSDGVSRRFLSA
jgi:hypothetical protein